MERAPTYPTIHGYRVRFTVDEYRDTLIVPSLGIEDEAEAVATVLQVARYGYPEGLITITQVNLGRWVPMGIWADPEHRAIYVHFD